MIATEYVVARWADGSFTITGWGLLTAVLLVYVIVLLRMVLR